MPEEHIDIRDLREGGFLWIDKKTLMLISKEVGKSGVLVYCWLCYYANSKNQNCFPSITTLSKLCQAKRHTVIGVINRLEQLKIISVDRKKGIASIYQLLNFLCKTTSASRGTGVPGDTTVVSPEALVPVSPETPEQELIEQDLNNKTFVFEKLFCGKLPFDKPNQKEIKALEDLCIEFLGEINLSKVILGYRQDKGYPPHPDVMGTVCKQFKKDKPKIRNVEGWFRRVVDLESSLFFANESIKEHKKYRREPTNIGRILSQMGASRGNAD